MPYCLYYTGVGDQQHCVNVSDKAACDGEYHADGSCGVCFFVSELSSYAIAKSDGDLVMEVAAQPGAWIASDFREVILRQSALGREIVELYAAHAVPAIEVLRKHPKLLLKSLKLVTKAILFAQDIIRIHSLNGYKVVTGAYKLQPKTVREIHKVADELRKAAPKGQFDHVLSRVEAISKQIEGMTTRQILEVLAPEQPHC